MRTPEVENAMRCRIHLHSHALALDAVAAVLHRTCDVTLIVQAAYYLRALEPLAAEVERLEDACSLHEGIIEVCETERNAAIQRAEAAEARVAELEAVRQDLLGKIVGWQDGARADHARIAELADKLLEQSRSNLKQYHATK